MHQRQQRHQRDLRPLTEVCGTARAVGAQRDGAASREQLAQHAERIAVVHNPRRKDYVPPRRAGVGRRRLERRRRR
eukprot:1412212-Prymnesium_polylepis.1